MAYAIVSLEGSKLQYRFLTLPLLIWVVIACIGPEDSFFCFSEKASVAQLDAHPTGDQEVAGSNLTTAPTSSSTG